VTVSCYFVITTVVIITNLLYVKLPLIGNDQKANETDSLDTLVNDDQQK